MTEQEREKHFREAFDALTKQYGVADFVPVYNIKTLGSGKDFNLNFTHLGFKVVLDPNWQLPTIEEKREARATRKNAKNGAKEPTEVESA